VQELLTGQGPIEQITAGHISPFGDGQGLFCKYSLKFKDRGGGMRQARDRERERGWWTVGIAMRSGWMMDSLTPPISFTTIITESMPLKRVRRKVEKREACAGSVR
jgi:hypothetical protein